MIRSVPNGAELYDNTLTTRLTKYIKTSVAIVCVYFRVAKLTLISPKSTNPISSPECLSHTKFSWIFISWNSTITYLSVSENDAVLLASSLTMSEWHPLVGLIWFL